MTTALILVDIQNDYFYGGALPCVGMAQAAQRAAALLARFRERAAPVVHVRHLAQREGAGFLVPGTRGAEIHHSVAPLDAEPVILKHFPNSFRQTDLHERLQAAGIDTLVFCGAMSHMCIDASVRAAFDLGYRCIVVDKACATRDLTLGGRTVAAADVHTAFMAALAQPYAQVVTDPDWVGPWPADPSGSVG
ncbi:cysteine hydrolase family protein [Castellaniella sp.]|uniref:cysteine hydrolase family protein n=1 Tax=Castellaniella sp. TaxID=1955812 RepID=UPI00355F87E0